MKTKIIELISNYIATKKPDSHKKDIKYWQLQGGKIIRNFEMLEKKFVQITSSDGEKTFLSYSETETNLRFFRSELSLEQVEILLK